MFRVSLVSLLACVGLAVVASVAPAGLLDNLSMVLSIVAGLICAAAFFFGVAQRVAPEEESPPKGKSGAGAGGNGAHSKRAA
jgi:hypothetical protein